MSRMKDLYIDVHNMGIDPDKIDLEDVEAFMEAYRYKTGHQMTVLRAIGEMYK